MSTSCYCTYNPGPSSRRQKMQQVSPFSLRTADLLVREGIYHRLPTLIFRCVCPLSLQSVRGSDLRKWRKAGWGMRNFLHSLWVLWDLFSTPQDRTCGLRLELSVYTNGHFFVLSFLEPWLGNVRERKTLTTGWVVFQILFFFPNLPAAVYFLGFSYSCSMYSV